MTKYKFKKTEIVKILGVSPRSVERWTDEKLEEELKKNCYKLIEKRKEGRSIFYYCNYEEYSMSNDEYLKGKFNVMDINNFKGYTKRKVESIENNELITRKDLCKETDTKITTSKNYDKKLIEKGVFSKDGYVYICVDKENNNQKSIVDRQAYNNFWRKNGAIQNQLKTLGKQFKDNEITSDDYFYIKSILLNETKGNYIFYKLSKIAVHYDNILCEMLLNS